MVPLLATGLHSFRAWHCERMCETRDLGAGSPGAVSCEFARGQILHWICPWFR
jgi:hypothetical protein